MANLLELLQESAKQYGSITALSEIKNNKYIDITFKELYENVTKAAIKIKSLGISEGSNISLCGGNSINWIISFFGIIGADCTVVPIDTKLNKKSKNFIYEFSESKIIITNSKDFDDHCNILSFDDLLDLKTSQEININNLKNIISLILFTSGTTGDPKGVMLSHENILSNIQVIREIADTEQSSFSILPLSHVYELTCNLLASIRNGTKVHFCSSLDSKNMFNELKMIKPNIMPVVPLILDKIKTNCLKNISKSRITMFIFKYTPKLFGYLLRKKTGLTNLKFFFCGGAPLNVETEKFFDLLGLKIIQGYGLSETSPLVSVNPLNKTKLGSVGKIIKTCSVRIGKNDEKTNGKIFVKGPNVFKGYFKNKSSTNQVLKNNELDTGDIGRFDEEGYLYITGREKFIILGPNGENIYPEQIEELVDQIEFVQESVVFSNDQKKLYVLLKLSDSITQKNIEIKRSIEKINSELEVGKRISKIYLFNEEFPKTSTQKIKRDFLNNIDLKKFELIN